MTAVPQTGSTALQREMLEPWLSVRKKGNAFDVEGMSTVACGYQVPRPDGQTDGIFAEWKWDGARLVVRNDRYGFHPLFYFVAPGHVAVSTSPLRLLAGGAPADLDAEALAVFLRLGFFIGEDTPFESIRVVPPNATFCWEDGTLQVSGGYCYGKPQHLSRDAAIEAYIELFRQAIRRRPPMDENFVVPLSGGRDSRHILFTLCHVGWRPRFAVTIPRYPPRAPEDERVAALVAAAAGVEHRLLRQDAPRLRAELRKNWLTKLCADEHAWYMDLIDYLQANATTVYDGMGGALSVAGRFLSRRTLGMFEAGNLEQLAADLLAGFGLYTEAMLERFLHPRFRRRMSRDVAIARLARDLQRHRDAPDPTKSFNFWNRTRREIALEPYALMRDIPAVFSPYLDHDVYDLLSSLPPSMLSPQLTSPDKSFHSDAIARGYPQYAHLPFEDKHAPTLPSHNHYSEFNRATATHLLKGGRPRFEVVNNAFLWPRLLLSLTSRRYAGRTPWLPSLALYFSQLEYARTLGSREVAAPVG